MLQIQIFRGTAPDPAGGAYSALPEPLTDGEGTHCRRQEPQPCSWPLEPRFYGSQGLTHYRVGNPTNDRFEM